MSPNGSGRYWQMLVSPHVGGGARLAMAIHQYVTETRGAVSRLLLPGGAEAETAAIEGAMPYRMYDVARLTGSSRLGTLLENLRLYRQIGARSDTLLHVHAPFVYGALKPLLKVSGVKSILHVHLDLTAQQLAWSLMHAPDALVLCAEFMQPAVNAALGAQTRRPVIRVVRNAVDTQTFFPGERAPLKHALGMSPGMPTALIAANLAPHKGQETAIRAIAHARAAGIDYALWIVGAERTGDRYLDTLRALATELGLADRVTFTGFRKDTPALMRAADFLLLPSTSEGLPLSILEAQASRTVVLAAPTAGVPEIVSDGVTGFLIAADDFAGYAARMISLTRDPQRAAAITEAAYARVLAHHTLRRYCESIGSIYDELLEESRPAGATLSAAPRQSQR